MLGLFQQTFPLLGLIVVFPTTSVNKVVAFNISFLLLSVMSLTSPFILNKVQYFFDFIYFFILSILKDSISIKKYSFVLILFSTFLFLFVSNVFGMFPYSSTVTSHLILTLYFSLAFFIGSNLIGICFHKEAFFVLFLPEGVPLVIVPFLILIEYISYLSRVFSLAIRLFANMLSGHILLKILISFIWILMSSHCIY